MNWFVFALFFVSGACGLIYEVVWSRMMTLIFGRSALAVGTVLAAFMSGLAIGSYLLGKYADRSRNPLRLYAFYEVGIGFTALAVSFLLTRLTPVSVLVSEVLGRSSPALAVSRFFIVLALMIIPTVLMGATLPILSRVCIRQLSCVDRELGRLYAINTAGAVAGSVLSGFFLIKHLGLHGTIYLAVMGNLLVGTLAWLVSRGTSVVSAVPAAALTKSTVPPPTPVDPHLRRTYRLALSAFALSGLASFAYEVFWTRSLVFVVGNTTYAFTLMLTAFLTGIALGGYGIRFVAEKVKSPLRLFASIEVLIGLFSAASLPLLFSTVNSPVIRSFISRTSGQLGLLALSDFGVALVLMLIPATLIGATLPLIGRIFLVDLQKTGTTVGKVYAVNTLGNVAGALLPGLLILPLLGVQKGILLMACLNVCLGVAIAISGWKRFTAAITATAVVFTMVVIFIPRMPLTFQFPSEYQTANDGVLFYREGGLVTTKVWASADTDYKSMSVDGINIGGTSDSDYKQQILAHLPKLLLKSYASELSIGLGSGILIGESAKHAALKKIVCVEISRGVAEGASYFSEENRHIMDDPRAVIVIDDIAGYLQTATEHYDIISADEKTTGKYASNSLSYSKEYYALLRRRLAPGGLVIQWMPTDLPPSQYSLAIRTFLDAFPHVTLWYFPPVGRFMLSNTFLVGSNEPVDINPVRMRQAMERDPESFQGIRKYGLTTADSILAHFIAGGQTLRLAIPPGPVNSFERPYYEFYSPRDYAVPSNIRALANHEWLMSVRGKDFDRYVRRGTEGPDLLHLMQAFQAEGAFLDGYTLQLQGLMPEAILPHYEQAIEMASWNRALCNEVLSFLNSEVRARYARGDISGAADFLHRAANIFPESAEARYDYGRMLLFMGANDPAIRELQQALILNPKLVPALRNVGVFYASQGQMDRAVEKWKEALSVNPDDIMSLVFYGIYLARQGAHSEAMDCLQNAYRLAPRNPKVAEAYLQVLGQFMR